MQEGGLCSGPARSLLGTRTAPAGALTLTPPGSFPALPHELGVWFPPKKKRSQVVKGSGKAASEAVAALSQGDTVLAGACGLPIQAHLWVRVPSVTRLGKRPHTGTLLHGQFCRDTKLGCLTPSLSLLL